MNWQEITAQVANTETLSSARLQQQLARIAKLKPDVASELTSYYTRNGKLNNFMQTSMTEAQRHEQLLKPGISLGVWKTGEVLGSGGMGDVYKAERSDGLYEQVVALKVIQSRDDDSLHRFELERKRLATLEHPGISRIIDGGVTEDGRSFMVMEYVEGKAIDQYVKDNKLTRHQSLKLFCDLCAAISHAHTKLILHRDIKTKNVLVDNEGTVRLIDFGIASAVGGGTEESAGPVTILYAPPEQLLRQAPVVGSDIFSMGVLLHHILTGKTPQRNPDGSVCIDEQKIADADISAIIKKATAFDANDRYSSATLFARDIDAYLNLTPVAARNGGSLHKTGKFLRRNLLASVLASGFIVALAAGLIGSLVMANKATREAERANLETVRANTELARAEWNVMFSNVENDISQVRADAFQYVFGTNEDQVALGDKFIEYLENSSEGEQENNTEIFATKSWVVGKHFLDRNDYVTARKVFEPWVESAYGNPLMLAFGQVSLGFVYDSLGEKKKAIDMFNAAEKYYRTSGVKNTIEHAVPIIQVALLSDDEADTSKATAFIESILPYESSHPFNYAYLIGQIYKLEQKQGNWAAAFDALSRITQLIEDGAYGRVVGIDTNHLNFAQMNIFYRGDLKLALKHIEYAQEITDTSKGESQSLGLIYELRAVLAWHGQDYENALTLSKQSLAILEKYTGKADNYADVLAKLGIIQSDAKNIEAARETLAELRQLPEEVTGVWPDLLNLYISVRQDGINSAQQIYADVSFPKRAIQKKLMPGYFLIQLQEDGLRL